MQQMISTASAVKMRFQGGLLFADRQCSNRPDCNVIIDTHRAVCMVAAKPPITRLLTQISVPPAWSYKNLVSGNQGHDHVCGALPAVFYSEAVIKRFLNRSP
jgi:hypothetical protein